MSLETILSYEMDDLLIFLKESEDELFEMVPELKPMKGFQQNNPHHIYDVWDHTKVALAAANQDLIVRLAVLFHDTGKPRCYTEDEEGTGHFYRHGLISADITDQVMKRLGFTDSVREQVVTLVKYHDIRLAGKRKSIRAWLHKIGEDQFRRLLQVQICDARGQNPEYLSEKLERVEKVERILEEIIVQEENFQIKDLAIAGSDLICLGYEPGRLIGEVLKKLTDCVREEILINDRKVLLETAEVWLKEV
jgi:tRNA nucleotidyltransferase (CCA-adding enzyme)